MTFVEAAQYLGLSRQRVHVLVSSHKLNPVTHPETGRRVLLKVEVEARRERVTPGTFHAPNVEGYVTMQEVASACGVAVPTISSWITAGKLGSAFIGSRRMIPKDEAARIIAERGDRPSRE